MSQTIQATAADYLEDACREIGSTTKVLFDHPRTNTREKSHKRWACLRRAKELSGEDGNRYTQIEWAEACGMSMGTIYTSHRRSTVRLYDIGHIIDAACGQCGVLPDMLRSKIRHPSVVTARMLVVQAARMTTVLSFPEIAVALGKPNHSTTHTMWTRFNKQTENGQRPDLIAMLEAVLFTCAERIGPASVQGNLDPALLVTPPKGLEIGYVPIVTRQGAKE